MADQKQTIIELQAMADDGEYFVPYRREEIARNAISVITEQRDTIDRLKVKTVKQSRWVKDEKRFGNNDYHCERCGAILEGDEIGRHFYEYCYHCGSQMTETRAF